MLILNSQPTTITDYNVSRIELSDLIYQEIFENLRNNIRLIVLYD